MSDGPKLPGPPTGADLSAGEAPVPWGASSESAVLEEVVRRLAAYGGATVRLDRYTPYPLDGAAFLAEMERLARALPAPATVEALDFSCAFRGDGSAFRDPDRLHVNIRLRRAFMDRLEELGRSLTVDGLEARPPAGALMADDFVPPGTRVRVSRGTRDLSFVLEARSVEEVAWTTGRESTVLSDGITLDGPELEDFVLRVRRFFGEGI